MAVVNQALVVRHFGSENPIGQSIRLARLATLPEPVLDPTFEIVGVIGDIPNDGTRETIAGRVRADQRDARRFRACLVLRTAGDPAPMLNGIRRELRAVDRAVAVNEVVTVQEGFSRRTRSPGSPCSSSPPLQARGCCWWPSASTA